MLRGRHLFSACVCERLRCCGSNDAAQVLLLSTRSALRLRSGSGRSRTTRASTFAVPARQDHAKDLSTCQLLLLSALSALPLLLPALVLGPLAMPRAAAPRMMLRVPPTPRRRAPRRLLGLNRPAVRRFAPRSPPGFRLAPAPTAARTMHLTLVGVAPARCTEPPPPPRDPCTRQRGSRASLEPRELQRAPGDPCAHRPPTHTAGSCRQAQLMPIAGPMPPVASPADGSEQMQNPTHAQRTWGRRR